MSDAPIPLDRPVAALTYERIDQWIASLQLELAREAFACAVGILRGGGTLALMVSHTVGVPPAFLRYERATRAVSWDSSIPIPPAGAKVLLCEDLAGAGNTLTDCIEFLKSHGLEVKTLTAGFDDLSRIRPDYALDGRGYFLLFPWERHAQTGTYRAAWRRTEAGRLGALGADHEYVAYGIDLDGILLPDVPSAHYEVDLQAALAERDALLPYSTLPDFKLEHANAIATGRPEIDRARTETWLARHGFGAIPLFMRNVSLHRDIPEEVAAHKAQVARQTACTHFIESDPVQAVLIAQYAPLLRVIWWDAASARGTLIAAHAWPHAAAPSGDSF